MPSIATQLFRSVVPGIVFALVTGGLVLDLLIGERLEREFDEVLATKAHSLMALTEMENGVVELERYEEVLPGYSDRAQPDYFLMLLPDGRTIAKSPTLDEETWLASLTHSTENAHRDVQLPDGRHGRVLSARFVPSIEDEEGGVVSEPITATLTLAIDREPLDKLLRSVHLVLAGTGLTLAAIIVLLARRGIARTVAPLEAIGEQVAALDPGRLDQRLELDASSDELERLKGRFNELLERLDVAFARERQFSADVAHELRTPLTELVTLGEVSARWPDDPTIRASFHDDHATAVARMQRTLTSLLALGRSESGVEVLGAPVDLPTLVERTVKEIERRHPGCEIVFRFVPSREGLPVIGGEQWQGVVTNLLDNACEYARTNSPIDITLERRSEESDTFRLSVVNESDNVEPDDLEHFFERLWRKDPARSSGRHSGLGLSLVRAYAGQLGVSASVSLDARRRVRVQVDGIAPYRAPSAPVAQAPADPSSSDGSAPGDATGALGTT